MKKFSTLAAMCLCAGLWGCAASNSDTAMMTSPGAVGDNACSSQSDADCSGKVCPMTGKPAASMGAVGDSPCSSKKSDCSTKVCPMTGKPVASLGAVSDDASCATKQSCSTMKKSCGTK